MMKPSEGGPRDGIRRLLERLQTQLDDEAAAGSSQSSSSGSSNGAGSSAGSSGVPRAIVLACGGDGTFNWVCSELFAAAAGESGGGAGVLGLVDVVPLPLGTGNDVGRALGWGGRQPGRADIARLFGGDGGGPLRAAPRSSLDIWHVTFGSAENAQRAKLGQMQNYFSIGVDAEAALRFGQARDKHPGAFRSQVTTRGTRVVGASPEPEQTGAHRVLRVLARVTRARSACTRDFFFFFFNISRVLVFVTPATDGQQGHIRGPRGAPLPRWRL